MDKSALTILLKELIWLIAIIGLSALIEFIIIDTFDLHPVLSIKLQGLIGLIIIGYGIRMAARLWKAFHSSEDLNIEETESSDYNNS
jgi:cadmium resistance protein CadD (predicted permease)